MRFSETLVALRYPAFRRLFIGQAISVTGSMMQSAALLWHVALLVPAEDRGTALGLVGLSRFVPICLFALWGGVVADSVDRVKLMLRTQVALLGVAALLGVLTFAGLATPLLIYALSAVGAAATAFDAPARQSLAPTLVPREHLPNAVSLNVVVFQVASVAGPALGGLLIGSFGAGQSGVAWVYALNAASFLAVVIALAGMPAAAPPEPTTQSGLHAAVEGFRFVFGTPLLRSTMLLDFFATFFSSATFLLPMMALDPTLLGVGPEAYGWLQAAPAVGAALTSAVMVPALARLDRRGVVLLVAVVGYGLATVLFGVARSLMIAFLALFLTGVFDTISMTIRHVLRQLHTPDHLRGRMTGVNMIFFMGGPQLGEFEAGIVARLTSAPVSVISGGVACVVSTLWIAWRDRELRAYRGR